VKKSKENNVNQDECLDPGCTDGSGHTLLLLRNGENGARKAKDWDRETCRSWKLKGEAKAKQMIKDQEF